MTTPSLLRTIAAAGLLLLVQLSPADAGTITDDGRIRGSADAPITLIEYSDFTCGYCAKFFQETLPRLQAKYIDTGKVRFLYRDYPRADQGSRRRSGGGGALCRSSGAILADARSTLQRTRPPRLRIFQRVRQGDRLGPDGVCQVFRRTAVSRIYFQGSPRGDPLGFSWDSWFYSDTNGWWAH